ncbi:MAG: NADPH-dependent F420 reductase [Anaerolineae bacterium]|nr:NADPH-dependent F420 reductase [Anaerolineae bacterium]
MPKDTILSIAVLGGTGKEGSTLAMRWARSGYRVIIGSRSLEKAQQKVEAFNAQLGDDYLLPADNAAAAAQADIVVLSVPYSAHKATLEAVQAQLDGKILIDVTVPLDPNDVFTVHLPPGGAASLEAQTMLGDRVRVVAAFQNVSFVKLKDLDGDVDCDVLVCGDDPDAKVEALQLVEAAGMRGIDAGPLANAVAVESLTPVLLSINRRYKIKGAGIRITGLPTGQ